MDGAARRPRAERGREGVLPRACRPAGARASATSSTIAAASAGSRERHGRTFRHAGNPRSGSARARAARALPRRSRTPRRRRPRSRGSSADVEPRRSRRARRSPALPVTRKSALLELQKSDRPLRRSRRDAGWGEAARVFASPGPIYEPEGRGADYWRLARALFAAGFRRGDLVHNCFSYHFTPAGSMLETGALALGCTVFPAGTGQTEQQVQAMAELKPAGYVGTPSFLKIILEKADEMGVPLPSLSKALVSAEAFPQEPVRRAARPRHRRLPGVRVGRPRLDRLRDRGARGARRRRGRAGRDRAARHRRSGGGGRSRRSRRDVALQHGLSADPLRHRRPFRRAAGSEPLRPHQRAHQGLDGPRRPDDEGEGHVRASGAGRGDRRAPSGDRQGAARRRQRRRAPTA